MPVALALLTLGAIVGGWGVVREISLEVRGNLADVGATDHHGQANLYQGGRYRVSVLSSMPDPVTCVFIPSDASPSSSPGGPLPAGAFSQTFSGPRPSRAYLESLGTFTAPSTGVFDVTCGSGNSDNIWVDRLPLVSTRTLLGLGAAALVLGLVVLFVAVRQRRRDRPPPVQPPAT